MDPTPMPARLLAAITHDPSSARSSVVLHPWTFAGATVATDGKMMLRVNAILGHPPLPANFLDTVSRLLGDTLPERGTVHIPALKAWAGAAFSTVATECPACRGKMRVGCRECKGRGHYDCPTCGQETDCDECDGKGDVKCRECNATGAAIPIPDIAPGRVPGADRPFDRVRVAALAALLPDDHPPVRVQSGRLADRSDMGELLRLVGPDWVFVLLCLSGATGEVPVLELEPAEVA